MLPLLSPPIVGCAAVRQEQGVPATSKGGRATALASLIRSALLGLPA
jgi:hypothetical protein